jgi:ubiquinone/menaquinone biosynthesis C-methylase UbiE
MQQDPFAAFKAVQREAWGLFAPTEIFTTPPAAQLVNHAGIKQGDKVLDVACGTGVVAITAARLGASVKGLDLAPALLDRAKWNANLGGVTVEFTEGDAESLPYQDGEFDVVVSQFGHMFAPRPDVATAEMLRVLKPGGTIAFSTWPPELFVGKMFALTGKYMPPPEGVAPPPQWGNPQIIAERLGSAVKDIVFDRKVMHVPALSPQHLRYFMETNVGPLVKVVEKGQSDPEMLATFRKEFEALITLFRSDNQVSQHYLMTRATKI